MNAKMIADMAPDDETVAGISAALDRIAAARKAALQAEAKAADDLAASALTLTSKARRDLQDAAEDGALDALQLAAMAANLQPRLDAARHAERIAAATESRAVLMARMDAANAEWAEHYPAIHKALKALLDERAAIMRASELHNEAADCSFDTYDLRINQEAFLNVSNHACVAKSAGELEADERQAWWDKMPADLKALKLQAEYLQANPPAPRIVPNVAPRAFTTVGGELVTYGPG